MSEDQRQAESDRRRQAYQMRISNMPNVQMRNPSTQSEDMEDLMLNNQASTQGRIRLSNVRRLARSIPIASSHGESSTSGTLNIDVNDPELNTQTRTRGRVRLTNVRRLARSLPITTSHGEASTSGTSNIDVNGNSHDRGGQTTIPIQGDLHDNLELSMSSSGSENEGSHDQVGGQQRIQSRSFNCARKFHESRGFFKHRLPIPTICPSCQAKLFKSETRGLYVGIYDSYHYARWIIII